MTESQQEVFDILKKWGPFPDHVLVPVVQHLGKRHMSSSGVRTRRNELEKTGKVRETGQFVETPTGRMASVWKAV